MRADRFALTVRVSRQIHGFGFLRCLLQPFYNIGLVGTNLVCGFEVPLDIDAQFFPGQIHDVAIGRLDRVIAAEIFVDGLRLGRRLDND